MSVFDIAFVALLDVEYPSNIRRISVEYPTMYVGEQYSIVDIQAIEIIERRRMAADGDGPIIWPSQG